MQYAIQEEFLKANLCVRNVWVAWYNAYKAATNVDAPNRGSTNANIPNIYDNFSMYRVCVPLGGA
jgi:hypothetical protein